MAVKNDSRKLSKGSFAGGIAGFHSHTARAAMRKQVEFRLKIHLAPIRGSRRPPTVGPATAAILSCKPPSVVAEGNSSLETTSGRIAGHVGAVKAKPTPSRNTQRRTRKGLSKPSEPNA